jgi:DNA-binding transcriptional LysR family regulator
MIASFKLIVKMMNIKENDFRRADLNLLVAFLVLMRERSVSRAAERLHLGQPAMSGVLARLRELFGDPLFVRTRTGMEPTSRALQLENRLKPALHAVHAAIFEDTGFEPANADHTFVIGMPDWVEIWLAPLLFAALKEQAPSVRLSIVNTDPFRVSAMLEQGEMDLAISPVSKLPTWCKRSKLRQMPFKCVFRPKSRTARKELSLNAYLERTHLLVSYKNAFESAADKWLATQSLKRKVIFATTRFGILPALLQEEMTITTVPEAIAQRWQAEFGLHLAESPVPMPPVTVSAAWLTTRDSEAPLCWLRGVVESFSGS